MTHGRSAENHKHISYTTTLSLFKLRGMYPSSLVRLKFKITIKIEPDSKPVTKIQIVP
jgi:hypothetical protein